jgi:dTDP-4-dehydrorhamnose 3,5-epimerase
MKITKLTIPEVLLIEPVIFQDNRGFFFESFNLTKFQEATSLDVIFVQDNHSKSTQGILRGLHYQLPPHAQGKLVRVIQGEVLDVAVDIRKDSATYGKHVAVKLSGDNKQQLYIPPGFAHGFLTLEDHTIFVYKCTNYYHPESEGGILWSSPSLGIDWGFEANGIGDPTLSAKDLVLPDFADFQSPF